jgi:Arc/MetJ-type ribon-helix-helix transcriptional regulator
MPTPMSVPRLAVAVALLALAPFAEAADSPAGLKDCPPFEELRKLEAAKIAAKQLKPLDSAPTKPELHKELLAMMERDQNARANAAASAKANNGRPNQPFILAIFQADQDNSSRLRELVEAGEFPTPQQVGRDGIRAIWLIAAHSDRDPVLQGKLLALLEPLARSGDLVPQDFALLSDRVSIARGEPQRYGTQFRPVAGISRPQPIADFDFLEARRAETGLLTLREYGCLLQQFHGIPVDLTPLAP